MPIFVLFLFCVPWTCKLKYIRQVFNSSVSTKIVFSRHIYKVPGCFHIKIALYRQHILANCVLTIFLLSVSAYTVGDEEG